MKKSLVVLLLLTFAVSTSVNAQTGPIVASCPVTVSGDINCSGTVNSADILTLVNFVFRSQGTPCPHPLVADVNLDGDVTSADVIALVDYVFKAGTTPGDICAAYFGDSALAHEAERMAAAYGGEVYAPAALKWEIYRDLADIRDTYRDSIPEVDSVGFISPWFANQVTLAVDSGTYDAIKAGTYSEWDALNAEYAPQSIYVSVNAHYVNLYFFDTMNPQALAYLYATLPGVTTAYPDKWAGDWGSIYLLTDNDVRAYIFRQAWGDCTVGCIYSRLWYFLITPTGLEYMGYAEPPGTIPGWWPIAVAAMDAYSQL